MASSRACSSVVEELMGKLAALWLWRRAHLLLPQAEPSGLLFFKMLCIMNQSLETRAEKHHNTNRTSGRFLRFIF